MPIAEALVKANKAKGIMVEVILNRGKANFPIADYLNSNGIPVKIDSHHTNHNKVFVIDGETVITGSYNLSKDAEERNRENLVVIHAKEAAERFTTDWNKHAAESAEYKGKER
jgi:phosphatidylserine/phosphatidylglycerophosphate/cardiolipin synthase-like enzyme